MNVNETNKKKQAKMENVKYSTISAPVVNKVTSSKWLFVSAVIFALAAIVTSVWNTDLLERMMYTTGVQRSGGERDGGADRHDGEKLFSPEELKLYDGRGGEFAPLYLAILGRVFDVSAGRRHYEPGASYHSFVGGDRSRCFITGEFTETGGEQAHVLDLSCADLSGLQRWLHTYHTQYIYKGKLVGLHFDPAGEETEYGASLAARLASCEAEARATERRDRQLPPCNMQWSADTGTRVWCTTSSGGVKRAWAGVPRQLYEAGATAARCVCVSSEPEHAAAALQLYPHCTPTAHECFLNT